MVKLISNNKTKRTDLEFVETLDSRRERECVHVDGERRLPVLQQQKLSSVLLV